MMRRVQIMLADCEGTEFVDIVTPGVPRADNSGPLAAR